MAKRNRLWGCGRRVWCNRSGQEWPCREGGSWGRVWNEVQAVRISGKGILVKRKSKCKSQEVGTGLVCCRISKEARGPGTERAGRWEWVQIRRDWGHCKDLGFYSESRESLESSEQWNGEQTIERECDSRKPVRRLLNNLSKKWWRLKPRWYGKECGWGKEMVFWVSWVELSPEKVCWSPNS